MASSCGQSAVECEIIKKQIERRLKYRCEYLRMRTDPCQHAKEAGYLFDPACQRFISMKCKQFDTFKPAPGNAIRAALLILPFFVYGYFIWKDRSEREDLIRCGKILYKDRLFKLA